LHFGGEIEEFGMAGHLIISLKSRGEGKESSLTKAGVREIVGRK